MYNRLFPLCEKLEKLETYTGKWQTLYGRGCAAALNRRVINCIVIYSLVARRRDNHADVRFPHRFTRLGVSLLYDQRDRDYMERGVVLAGIRFTVAASANQHGGATLYREFNWDDHHQQGCNSSCIYKMRLF